MRADFFGPRGDTTWNRQRLEATCRRFTPPRRSTSATAPASTRLLQPGSFDLVIHAAAQPSHDLAAKRPFDDFDVNAVGTLNLLEATRRHTPEAVFILMSTNKVYGDGPNHMPLIELETRWDYADPRYAEGIPETFSIDHCHALALRRRPRWPATSRPGVRPLLRPEDRHLPRRLPHRPAALRRRAARLPQLPRAHARSRGGPYTIFGYKGKQVRDQIHSHDVINAFWRLRPESPAGRGLQPRRRPGQRRQPARVRRADRRDRSGKRPEAHLRRAGPHRRPHLLLLRPGQVPGPLPRVAPGATRCRPSSRRWSARGDRPAPPDAARRVRLTLLNQFYAPDISPTAQLAASLAEHRADRGDQVTIVTGRAGYLEGLAPAGVVRTGPGLRIRRVWTPDSSASRPRAAGCSGTPRSRSEAALADAPAPAPGRHRRDDDTAVRGGRRACVHQVLHRGTRVVLWSMDCYPDAAERFGELRPGGLVSRALRAVNRWAFRRVEVVVGLDTAMVELLESQYAQRSRPTPLRGDPQLGAAWRCSRRRPTRAAPWPGYDDLGGRRSHRRAVPGQHRRGPPLRHGAGRRRAAGRRGALPVRRRRRALAGPPGRGDERAGSPTSSSAPTSPRTRPRPSWPGPTSRSSRCTTARWA